MNGKSTVQSITDGAQIAAGDRRRGIRVNVSGNVGSVKFVLSGGHSRTAVTTENLVGFDLFHTDGHGGSIGHYWKKGTYTLTVQLFSGRNGHGTEIGEQTLHFTIV